MNIGINKDRNFEQAEHRRAGGTKSTEEKETLIANLIAVFCMCVLIISAVIVFFPVNGEEKMFSDMIRLHVLANSDSREDQDLKLKVRDYILNDIAELTQDSADSREAAEKIQRGLGDIEMSVREFLRRQGYNFEVDAVFSRERYPRRIYTDANADYIFPAGEYNSLRIKIGAASGENWWCVLFPPLCFSSAMRIDETLAVMGYTDEQISLMRREHEDGAGGGVSGARYDVRLWFLEFLSGLLN